MKDWVTLITAIIQCYTAYLVYKTSRKKEKGTKQRRFPRNRK
ncbi:hypothetical protein RJP21_04765 [Paenibacillus sp. VCA1]|nr:hypothetical protein [Paenibacillus sp. VCA1]MDR9852912.1 hypothetical protein [Paenibacillus sp. VCA1]